MANLFVERMDSMSKKQRLIFGGALITVFLILVTLGVTFNKANNEKQMNGLSYHYDVSSSDLIAYVIYKDGHPELHLYRLNDSADQKIFELEGDKMIVDPTFSNDGTYLAFVSINKDLETDLSSTVHLLNINNNEVKSLFTKNAVITEIEFSPERLHSLFYLNASSFESYSPITSKRPHNFDIYEYDLKENKHVQRTKLKAYEMNSLNTGSDSLYVQMFDDSNEQTAEDVFNTVERIFKIPIDHPDYLQIISPPNRKVGTYDFALWPNEREIIFQSISNSGTNDIYQYELFEYNLETNEERQLTNLGGSASNPVVHAKLEKVYFMLDQRFGKGDPDYHLYEMNKDGTAINEIPLPSIE